MSKTISATLFALLAAVTFSLSVTVPGSPARAGETAPTAETKKLDQVILKSGRVVEGEILEETDSTIRIMVKHGSISAPATYQKSEVLEIKRGAVTPKSEAKKTAAAATPKTTEESAKKTGDENAAQLYIVNLTGIFGIDSSQTPLQEAFEEINEYFGDIGPDGKVNSDVRDKHIVVIKMDTETNPAQGFDGMWRAEAIGPVIEKEIWDRSRRVVFWIENASGGASFLPWVSPEIYFTTEGIMGGIGTLDDFDIGDVMVNEKQISLRLGHAHGFAIKGGYVDIGPPIIDAMAREGEWLCVKWVGGKPEFLKTAPPEGEVHEWTVLTDDGEGQNKDEWEYKGNDILRINADLALKLGLSKGTAETVDELAYLLGIGRNYTAHEEETKAQKIVDAWSDNIQRAIDDIRAPQSQNPGRLWVKFAEIQVGGDFKDRSRARGLQIRTLKEIRGILTRYAEVFDDDGTQRAELDVQIAVIQQQQEEDSRAQRSVNREG